MEVDMAFRLVPIAGLVLAMLATPALAQQQPSSADVDPSARAPRTAGGSAPACGDRNDLLTQLKDKYKESPTGIGMTGQGSVVELMTSENGSWTLVLSFPNGRSCLMATGEGWELWQARMAGKGA
jgi:hypothetical protein